MTKNTVDIIYEDAAAFHNITVEELIYRIVNNAETLIHQYYLGKYGLGF